MAGAADGAQVGPRGPGRGARAGVAVLAAGAVLLVLVVAASRDLAGAGDGAERHRGLQRRADLAACVVTVSALVAEGVDGAIARSIVQDDLGPHGEDVQGAAAPHIVEIGRGDFLFLIGPGHPVKEQHSARVAHHVDVGGRTAPHPVQPLGGFGHHHQPGRAVVVDNGPAVAHGEDVGGRAAPHPVQGRDRGQGHVFPGGAVVAADQPGMAHHEDVC